MRNDWLNAGERFGFILVFLYSPTAATDHFGSWFQNPNNISRTVCTVISTHPESQILNGQIESFLEVIQPFGGSTVYVYEIWLSLVERARIFIFDPPPPIWVVIFNFFFKQKCQKLQFRFQWNSSQSKQFRSYNQFR